MHRNAWWGKTLRFIGIVLMALTSGFILLGGIGTTCAALFPTNWETMAPLAAFQWLYILFAISGIAIGVWGILATIQLVRGTTDAYKTSLLALSILFRIPTHTLTYSMKFRNDYKNAGVPTFPERYGERVTRMVIAISSVLAAISIGWASILIGLSAGLLSLITVLTAVMLILAFATLRIHTDRMNFMLFRYASPYMLTAMIILTIQGLM